MKKTYSELLRDPRWQKKRLEALDSADFACEQCRDKTKTLNVHHRAYRKGANPWEYDLTELQVLCESCHKLRHGIEGAITALCSAADPVQLMVILGFAKAVMLRNFESLPVLHKYELIGLATFAKGAFTCDDIGRKISESLEGTDGTLTHEAFSDFVEPPKPAAIT